MRKSGLASPVLLLDYWCQAGIALVNLLLLVDAELAGAAVDEQEQTTDNRKNLEEVVLGKVLVRVVGVELGFNTISENETGMLDSAEGTRRLQSRSCSPAG